MNDDEQIEASVEIGIKDGGFYDGEATVSYHEAEPPGAGWDHDATILVKSGEAFASIHLDFEDVVQLARRLEEGDDPVTRLEDLE